jgi:hypothetical protein
MNIKKVRLLRSTIYAHGNSVGLLEDLITNNFKDIFNEEFQYVFNFRVL